MTRFSVLLGALACSLALPLRAGDLTDGTLVRIASNI
jgi:hypothetical protein